MMRFRSAVIPCLILVMACVSAQAGNAGSWTSTGGLHTARYGQAMVPLPDGRVLVAGGMGNAGVLASSEIYDPHTGGWTATGNLGVARSGADAVVLADGRVLLAGGCVNSCDTPIASTELYDPRTGMWSETGALNTPRYFHTAVLLESGKVLVAGGCSTAGCAANTNSGEVYDSATGVWTSTGSLHDARDHHTATVLTDGRVLVAGGFGTTKALGTSEVYDLAAGTWTRTGNLQMNRMNHTATLLRDGTVLAGGGKGGPFGDILCSAELFDPVAGAWTLTTTMRKMVEYHTAILTPRGKVLVAGGDTVKLINGQVVPIRRAQSKTYNPDTAKWVLRADMSHARTLHSAVLLQDGRILVVGGMGKKGILSSSELYQP